ncbi:NAD(P)-binding domain containing protein [Parasponia andersonii]|uniref:NAD(P)-binding domain containing protein n=1 Tax=Parasponia andersonii TaxID=3476 RepID=A0A2P5BE45_PARAD|nr:NAD(P)-binding domain containing protein [Parasponia andersonii]
METERIMSGLSMATLLPSTLSLRTSLVAFSDHNSCCTTPLNSSFITTSSTMEKRLLFRCLAKKKISFTDQILDYIEGGPKLRKWYGAPDLLPKDGSDVEDEDDDSEEGARDAVLVTDGDSEIGQMVILSLIVKRARVKALVKDKRAALEAFGTYVESLAGGSRDKPFLKKALRGVRTIICPNEGFLSSIGNLKGVQHVILLSQVSVYKGAGGIQALMKSNAIKIAEQEESMLVASGIPYTIIRSGLLQDYPGGKQGFSFEEGSAARKSLSKEDAAFICVEAVDVVPQSGFAFEAVNGEENVSDWKECLTRLMDKAGQKPK